MPAYFIDLERLKYPNNGLYHFGLHLANELAGMVNSEEELFYYLPRNAQSLFNKKQSIHFVDYKFWHKFFIPNPNVDVWHITHQSSYFVPENKNTKCLLTIHDLNFLYTAKPEGEKKKLLQKIQSKINRADHIVVISNFIRAEIQKHLVLKDKPVSVIYNGFSLIPLNENVVLPLKPESEFIFTIGAIHPKKNMHVLCALLKDNTCQLIIAGSGSDNYKQQIVKQAKYLGVDDRLFFIGNISEEQKVWYYAHCKAFVFPSLSEGFGIPVIEAMAMGKPLFLSNLTSLPEIGGKYAYYFNSFEPEAMQKVFREGLISEAGNPQGEEERIRYASKFSWKSMAQEYLKLYRLLSDR